MKKYPGIRLATQLTFFIIVFFTALDEYFQFVGRDIAIIKSISLHGICPFGGVVSLFSLFTTGEFLPLIFKSNIILLGIFVLLAIFLGPVFCGWVCPFGAFQEWMGVLGKKIFGKKFNKLVPRKIHKVLKYLRYVVLVLVLINAAIKGELIFSKVDPYYALFHFYTGLATTLSVIALLVVMILSLMVSRPFCNYLCPLGAFFGLFNKIRIFKIKRKSTCISCQKCSRACPMNIEICNHDEIKDVSCISCMQCTLPSVCPKEDTLMLEVNKKARSYKFVAASLITVFTLVMASSFVFDFWDSGYKEIENNNHVVNEEEHKGKSEDKDEDEEEEHQHDIITSDNATEIIEGIRGSSNVLAVINALSIDEEVFFAAMQIEEKDWSLLKAKDFKTYYEFEVSVGTFRNYLALLVDAEYKHEEEGEEEEEIVLPTSAVEYLEKVRPDLDKELIDELKASSFDAGSMIVPDKEVIDSEPIKDTETNVSDSSNKGWLSLADGTYEGSANAYRPNLTVDVSVENGEIDNIKIVSHRETRGYYETAFEEIPKQIIETQSVEDIDYISRATYTSKGIVDAVKDALGLN